MTAVSRHNVVRHGTSGMPAMVLAHGFGCDQDMWRYVWPAFADAYDLVLFDHVGMGGSDASAFDPQRHGSLHGYAADLSISAERCAWKTSFSSDTRSAR